MSIKQFKKTYDHSYLGVLAVFLPLMDDGWKRPQRSGSGIFVPTQPKRSATDAFCCNLKSASVCLSGLTEAPPLAQKTGRGLPARLSAARL